MTHNFFANNTLGNRTGFTIVELLIVIVVIAILAAIAIVSYTGIQVRAKVSVYGDTVQQWEKSIKLYSSLGGAPLSNSYSQFYGGVTSTAVCLGRPEDYPADPQKNYQNEACYGGASVPVTSKASSAFMDYLEKGAGVKLPSLKNDIYGRNIRGLVYVTGTNSLLYWVPGDKCFGSDVSSSPFDGGIHCTRQLSS